MTLDILAICGSLRAASYNRRLADTLPELAPEGMAVTVLDGLGDFPHYDADLQAQGFPAIVEAWAEAIRAADGVILVSPEYNYSVPGVLKNAIDWLSRLRPNPFAGKPVALQSVSMGVMGGVRMQYHLRQSLVFLDARVMNGPEVFVGQAADRFSDTRLQEPGTRDFVAGQLSAFAAFIGR